MEEGVEGGVVGGVPGGVLGGVIGGTGDGPVMDYDQPPRPIKITRPQYPQEAFVKKIEGTVVVEILIDSHGRVVRARVIQSVPLLDAAALQTVYQWVFAPAVKHGRPVRDHRPRPRRASASSEPAEPRTAPAPVSKLPDAWTRPAICRKDLTARSLDTPRSRGLESASLRRLGQGLRESEARDGTAGSSRTSSIRTWWRTGPSNRKTLPVSLAAPR